jgi:hypothetical protein
MLLPYFLRTRRIYTMFIGDRRKRVDSMSNLQGAHGEEGPRFVGKRLSTTDINNMPGLESGLKNLLVGIRCAHHQPTCLNIRRNALCFLSGFSLRFGGFARETKNKTRSPLSPGPALSTDVAGGIAELRCRSVCANADRNRR